MAANTSCVARSEAAFPGALDLDKIVVCSGEERFILLYYGIESFVEQERFTKSLYRMLYSQLVTG